MRHTLGKQLALLVVAGALAAACGVATTAHTAAQAASDPCAANTHWAIVGQQAQPASIMANDGTVIGQIYATLWERVGKDSQGNTVDCYLYQVATRACSAVGQTLPAGGVSAFLGDRRTNESGFGGMTVGFGSVSDGACMGVVWSRSIYLSADSFLAADNDPIFGTGNYAGMGTVVTSTFTPRS